MDDWMVIISLSLAMLVGCYLAGCIPLAFSFSEEKLKLLTIFGAGLLVGTALAIIIPEGVNAIYSQSGHSHSEKAVTIGPMPDVHVHSRKLRAAEVPAVANPPVVPAHDHAHDHAHNDEHAETHDAGIEHEHHHEDEESEHKSIGVSLVIGFVFMLIVDQFGGGHSHGGGDSELQVAHTHSRNKITATLGLCVHAAADGIALGAATSVSQTGLTLVVFVAIMLHKAPAAFGLVSFLLHDGLDRGRIRRHLFLFSVAAPIGAILTFLVLNHQSKETLQQYNATGIAMLFSAGTFLYVATVHILPEVSSKNSRTISSDGTVIVREHKGFTKLELVTIILGSMLPVGISFTIGHGHSH